MELIFFVVIATILGIMIGLLPALPVFLAPMLILPFAQQISVEVMIMAWMLAMLGAQYFGSVAVITTRIPGEDNTLVYIRDLDGMTSLERIKLIRSTAMGSLVAGFVGAAILYVFFHWTPLENPAFFSLSWVQLLVYSSVIISFTIAEKQRWWAALLLGLIGVLLSTNNNYSIPTWWIEIQEIFDNTTMFMMTLGLVIIPHCMSQYDIKDKIQEYQIKVKEKFPWLLALRSSAIGFAAGMIPGPSSYIGTYIAYNLTSGNSKTRIIAAETANNSAAIATALPFFLTAIPINQATLLLLASLELNQVEINQVIWQTASTGLNLLDQLIITIMLCSVVYYVLATNFIKFYVSVIEFFHKKISLVLITLIISMCVVDIVTSGVNAMTYVLFTIVFSLTGLLLHKFMINPIPFLFGIIVGDRLVWSVLQTSKIYF
jgi:putative tricarboxylic transport membrane protein